MERFMELYEEVYRDLYRMACAYLGNAQEAEDAVSEAVLAAYENFGKLREEASFRPWIFKILINKCKSQLRRPSRRSSELEEERLFYEPGLSEKLEIMELLKILGEEERLVVALTVFGGYKGEEIAKLLHKNHSTVRSMYRRALKKLRQSLEGGRHEESQG